MKNCIHAWLPDYSKRGGAEAAKIRREKQLLVCFSLHPLRLGVKDVANQFWIK